MLFKNAKFYRLTQPVQVQVEDLISELEARQPGVMETSTLGFSPVISEPLTHKTGEAVTFKLQEAKRILPSRVVNRELAEKVSQIEAETGSPVGKKAQSDLKQEIITRLLPRAFVDVTYTYGSILHDSGLVVVYASSDGKAEAFLAMLRKALGSLPVVPLVGHSLNHLVTGWINSPPAKIEVLEKAKFITRDEMNTEHTVKNQDLHADEIAAALDAGKLVSELAIEFNESFQAVLTADGTLKGVKFSDRLIEENEDIPKDQVQARFDADMYLITKELACFAKFMISYFDLDEAA